MAAPSAKPLMDPTTTTVGQAAEQCGVNQKLSCCNGDDASSCSPVGSANLLQLLPISQACHADASPKCCETDNQTGLINLNLQCNDILSDIGLLGASKQASRFLRFSTVLLRLHLLVDTQSDGVYSDRGL